MRAEPLEARRNSIPAGALAASVASHQPREDVEATVPSPLGAPHPTLRGRRAIRGSTASATALFETCRRLGASDPALSELARNLAPPVAMSTRACGISVDPPRIRRLGEAEAGAQDECGRADHPPEQRRPGRGQARGAPIGPTLRRAPKRPVGKSLNPRNHESLMFDCPPPRAILRRLFCVGERRAEDGL